jgi:hypothetical protein
VVVVLLRMIQRGRVLLHVHHLLLLQVGLMLDLHTLLLLLLPQHRLLLLLVLLVSLPLP